MVDDLAAGRRPVVEPGSDTSAAVITTTAVPVQRPPSTRLLCQDGGCPPLECGAITAPREACDTQLLRFDLRHICGVERINVQWDWNDDTVPDTTGNPGSVILPEGSGRFRVRGIWLSYLYSCS